MGAEGAYAMLGLVALIDIVGLLYLSKSKGHETEEEEEDE